MRVCSDHSTEVRMHLSNHPNFHPWCTFTLQGNKIPKGMQIPGCLLSSKGAVMLSSVFVLQVKTAILGFQCYQQALPRQQKKTGKLQSCVGLQALCVFLLISSQTQPFCDDSIMQRALNYSHKQLTCFMSSQIVQQLCNIFLNTYCLEFALGIIPRKYSGFYTGSLKRLIFHVLRSTYTFWQSFRLYGVFPVPGYARLILTVFYFILGGKCPLHVFHLFINLMSICHSMHSLYRFFGQLK